MFRDLDDIAPNRKWWLRLLKPGFRHVEVWVNDRDVWVRMDPCFEILTLQAHLSHPADCINPGLSPTYVVVQKAIRPGSLGTPWNWGPMTCVDAAKAALGCRGLAITPYQLYRHLTKGP